MKKKAKQKNDHLNDELEKFSENSLNKIEL